METRNIEGFKLENPGMEFPNYRTLKPDETLEIRQRLKRFAELPEDADDLTLTKKIAALSVICSGENADNEKFNLLDTLRRFKIVPKGVLYVNFYRFDEIDEMSVHDVVRYFKFIWYPHSDDIELFDPTLTWIFSISHDGAVSLVNFKSIRRQP